MIQQIKNKKAGAVAAIPTITEIQNSSNSFSILARAVKYAGTTPRTLATLAYKHHGPRFYKPTARKALYRRSDLDAWITGIEVDA